MRTESKPSTLRRTLTLLACGLAFLAWGDGARAAKVKTLYFFCSRADCKDGTYPTALLRDSSGTLYGTTFGGGVHHGRGGMIYRFSGHRPHSLYSFCAPSRPRCITGAGPGPLIVDVAGNLYGTAQGLGANGFGNVFELSPNADRTVWTFSVLYSFCAQGGSHCTDGANPGTHAGLTYAGAASGAAYDGVSPLYGTTAGIPNTADGSVAYQLVPSEDHTTWTYTVIHTFCTDLFDCSDGVKPNAGMIMDPAGNLLGTTVYGGANGGGGVVFKLTPAGGGSWTDSVLYSFCALANCRDGAEPQTELVADAAGNLYGTTFSGGRNCTFDVTVIYQCGVLFKLSPNGPDWTETVLHTFCQSDTCKDGGHPDAALTLDASGTLFGTTLLGGSDINEPGGGTMFKFDGTFHHVVSFCTLDHCNDGYEPRGAMLMDATGLLYGTTTGGGPNQFGGGVLFKIRP